MKKKDDTHAAGRFRFVDHPWISLWVFLAFVILSMALSGTVIFGFLGFSQDSTTVQLVQSLLGHFLMLFVFVPFVLRLPEGRKPLKEYLDDIRLTRIRPLTRLLFMAVSCYVILALCQSLGGFIFRLTEGKAITGEFLKTLFDIRRELPPESLSLIVSFPSMFEEVAFRGVLLTFFLMKYKTHRAIVISSFGFSIIHALNLLSGRDPVWVAGQLVWSFILGMFYGYLFVRTGSLMPNMLFHYLGNVFVGAFNSYIQSTASMGIQVLYGVIFTFGLLPTALMILWVRFYTAKWPFDSRFERLIE